MLLRCTPRHISCDICSNNISSDLLSTRLR
jgi:hypothetical protein